MFFGLFRIDITELLWDPFVRATIKYAQGLLRLAACVYHGN
jgi:hypothetical protein